MSESVSSQNKRIIDALRTVIDLPDRVTSLDLSIRMDDVPRVDVSFVAMPPRVISTSSETNTLNDDDLRFISSRQPRG